MTDDGNAADDKQSHDGWHPKEVVYPKPRLASIGAVPPFLIFRHEKPPASLRREPGSLSDKISDSIVALGYRSSERDLLAGG
jgi:hypothetical protein